jgi:hypothetical protein
VAPVVTVWGMPYPSDLTNDQWELLEPSNGGFTFHDRGGPYLRTRGRARRGRRRDRPSPVGSLVVPASTHENRASELMLEHLSQQGDVTDRLHWCWWTVGTPR